MRCFRLAFSKMTIYRPWNERIQELVSDDINIEIISIPDAVWAVIVTLGETDRSGCTWIANLDIEHLVSSAKG